MNSHTPSPGIRRNLPQFSLLILINAFVGAMAGMERSVLPLIGEREFGITSHTAIVSFLITFGLAKAISNLLAGRLADRIGRKKVLVSGWLAGIPVPFVLMGAESWSWILAANILLGISQGLCWSATVIMKLDLAGPKQRGLAAGLNEFAGYVAVAIAAYASAVVAASFGLRPYPFYLGVAASTAGLLLSALFVRETAGFPRLESGGEAGASAGQPPPPQTTFRQLFMHTSWRDKNLFSCCQAGLVNNLNDGMVWGLFPLFFSSLGFDLRDIGILAAVYPGVWGISQVLTGIMSDKAGRKWMIAAGLWLQAGGIWMAISVREYSLEIIAAGILGIGTAMVYPTLLAAVGDSAQAEWRASAVGIYRLWRDLGYAVGGILSGLLADAFGLSPAIGAVGFLTLVSGVIVAVRFRE
jgi:MFS family permease